jgi:hypothetical protein
VQLPVADGVPVPADTGDLRARHVVELEEPIQLPPFSRLRSSMISGRNVR